MLASETPAAAVTRGRRGPADEERARRVDLLLDNLRDVTGCEGQDLVRWAEERQKEIDERVENVMECASALAARAIADRALSRLLPEPRASVEELPGGKWRIVR